MSASHDKVSSNDQNKKDLTKQRTAQLIIEISELDDQIKQLVKQTQEAEKEKFSLQQELYYFQKRPIQELNQEAAFEDLKKIQENIFRDRPKRNRDSYLPENNNSLSLVERKEVADERRCFKTEQSRKKRQTKLEDKKDT